MSKVKLRLRMLTADDKTNILAWTNEFLANSVECINNDVCRGISSEKLCRKIARVTVLKQNVINAAGYLTDLQIDNLYRRLQCLIDLKIED